LSSLCNHLSTRASEVPPTLRLHLCRSILDITTQDVILPIKGCYAPVHSQAVLICRNASSRTRYHAFVELGHSLLVRSHAQRRLRYRKLKTGFDKQCPLLVPVQTRSSRASRLTPGGTRDLGSPCLSALRPLLLDNGRTLTLSLSASETVSPVTCTRPRECGPMPCKTRVWGVQTQ
jgi:hypothetical protein